MNNIEFNSVVRVIGVVDFELLNNFIIETDAIMSAKLQYDEEMKYIKEEYVEPFPRIILEITSPGGSVDILFKMLAIIDKMRKLGIHVDTNVEGMAYSAGFILAIVGERRYASEWSSWMNHSSGANCGGKIEEIKNTVGFFDKNDEKLNKLIEKNTDLPKEHIEMARFKDMYYDYEEAIEYGIVNVYEGMEEEVDKEEYVKNVGNAFDKAIEIFIRESKLDGEDGLFVLHDILSNIIEEILCEEEDFDEEDEIEEDFDDDEIL